jgi:HSP20 family protein
MEQNVVKVKTMTPAVLEELEDLRSRRAQRTVELFTDRRRSSGAKLDHGFPARQGVVSRPQTAIAETDTHVEVRVALPGFQSDEVTVFVEPRTITISGRRKKQTPTANEYVKYSDISTGEVFRRLQLPMEVNPDRARAALRDGILSLILPKAGTSDKKEVNAEGPSAA